MKNHYIVATVKPWHYRVFDEVIRHYPGIWYLFTQPHHLTVENIKTINPKYIFFPHWSSKVPKEILELAPCICFHPAPLPFGRGSSLIQHLIQKGWTETVITAFNMRESLDNGPIILRCPLSLYGSAEEIYLRSAYIIADMVKVIITKPLSYIMVQGDPNQYRKDKIFKRRTPEMSEIIDIKSLNKLFDHIRMLDAETYPPAYLETDDFRFEFTRPARRTNYIEATVKIRERHEES